MRKSNLMVSAMAAVGAIFGFSAANAADFPATYTKAPPPILAAVYEWGGFYVGANGGWGGDQKCWNLNSDLGGPVANGDIGCSRGSGGVAGGQIGYRWQASAFVFGLEAQGDWANLKGSSASLRNPLVTNQSQINGLGLFTGQMGYAWNNVLFYLKGGAAVAADKYNGVGTATGIVFDQVTEKRWGGTAGAGVEFAFAPNWSVALEYDHLFMGNANNTFVSTGMGVNNLAPAGVAGTSIFARTSTWPPRGSTIASAPRSSRDTDLTFYPSANLRAPASSGAFLCRRNRARLDLRVGHRLQCQAWQDDLLALAAVVHQHPWMRHEGLLRV